tara:strand:- start:421 stop:726 length:306 start_codon:yes stop_codon:yes gene_type:complete
MKRLFLLLITTSIISSCGNSESENDPQKNIFVSECAASANNVFPMGEKADEMCECIWNTTVESMNEKEIAAMRRDWSNPSDMQYYSSFLSKTMTNSTKCAL